jgi:small subunit ribosomal protein S18
VAGQKARGRAKKRVVEKPRRGKPKVCVFCRDRIPWVDYKDTDLLRRLMTDRGKIKARRVSGTCRQHQREVAAAIKTAREMALLPYVLRPAADKSGRRDGRGPGRGGRAPFPAGNGAAAPTATPGPEDAVEPSTAEPDAAEDGGRESTVGGGRPAPPGR